MTTAELLQRLQATGVRLDLRDGRLKINAPKGALDDELKAELKAHKNALIELLQQTSSANAPASQKIPRADRSKAMALSFAQQRIWFLEEFEGGSSTYNIPWAMRIRGELQPGALQAAINDLVARHESLRTTFSKTDGEPVQIIHTDTKVPLEHSRRPSASDAELQAQIEEWSRTRFNLTTGPLLRIGLLEVSDSDWVLSLVIHHIISDGWSLDVLQRELFAFYRGHVSGQPYKPEPLPLQLADYAVWQRGLAGDAALAQQLAYWQQTLQGATPILELPLDHARPAEQSYKGSHLRRSFAPELSEQLRQLARDNNVTLFMLLLAAFNVLLSRYADQDDVVVGTPIAGRGQSELEGLIGLFLNTLAIRTDLSADPSFSALLEQVQTNTLNAFANQDIPFDRVVDALGTPRELSHAPVFQVQFILQNAPASGQALDGLTFEALEFDYGTAKFDLTLAMAESDAGIAAEVEYSTDLFAAESIERLLQHFEVLLVAIVSQPDTRVSLLPLLPEPERQTLLVELNNTAVDFSGDPTLQTLLEQQAAATPLNTALIFESEELSYAELNARVNQLAHYLIAAGIKPDARVGIYMERSTEMVIALLATIKAGGAYVPLDPEYPEQRVLQMLEDAGPVVVLTHNRCAATLPNVATRILNINTLRHELEVQPADNPPQSAAPDNLAYIIFTSGSTGRPKGVMNEHRGICNRLRWMQQEYKLSSNDRVLQKTPFSFDVSVWEFFWPLISGASLIVAKPGGHRDSDYLCELIREREITTLHFVPSMLQVFLQNEAASHCTSLKRVICSGEALPYELQARFFRHFTTAELHNLYGPTEAAIDVSYWACQRDSADPSVPIGRPVANTHLYIVDRHGQLAPRGVAGELWIGGVQVARGYCNRPDLTAERFLPDPFSSAQNARVYRTGDLVRYRNDGAIEFLGRIDQQIKLRGFRIELGEIEASLDGLAAVEQSLVMLREDSPGIKQLVAYISGSSGQQVDIPALREALKTTLPDYMVPAAFVALDAFPLLPNGKVDRNALPEPDGIRDVATEYVPPGTPAEKTLATIWAELLRTDRVGINDNFFDLGGDSILSIQIITRAAREGLGLQPKHIFRYQTIAELAEVASDTLQTAAEQGLVLGHARLTPVQQWFIEQSEQHWAHFNQSIRLRLTKTIEASVLEQALQAIVRHHDALRMALIDGDTAWLQKFTNLPDHALLSTETIAENNKAEGEAQLLNSANELQASLDLTSGCLLTARLFEFSTDGAQELLIIVHHVAMDGLSWRILLEDLNTVCTQIEHDAEVALPPKTTSFLHWSELLHKYAQSPQLEAQRQSWQQLTHDVEPIPVDKPDGDNTVADSQRVNLSLNAELTKKLLQNAPAAYRTQINDLLLTAFARAWQRWSGQSKVLIDLEAHGREDVFADADVSRTVGWFTTIFPLKLQADGDEAVADSIKRTKEILRNVPDNGFGFGVLRYLAEPAMESVDAQILFNYLGQFDQSFSDDGRFAMSTGGRGYEQAPERERSHLLEINGGVYSGELNISIAYGTQCHDEASIAKLADDYRDALVQLIDHCASRPAPTFTPTDFPLLGFSQTDLDQLQAEYSGLEDLYPLTPMQHGMFFHSQLAAESKNGLSPAADQAYVTQVVWDLEGKLDPQAFQQAWQTLCDRHMVLRSSYLQRKNEEPFALVHKNVPIKFAQMDWRSLKPAQQETALQTLLASDRARGFDLAKAPLMRLFLCRCSEDYYKFIWSHHHIIMDGWSIPVLLRELFQCLEATTAERQVQLPPVRSYANYLNWLAEQDRNSAENYWRKSLAGFDAATPLPGATKDYRGSSAETAHVRHHETLPKKATAALRVLAKQQRLTLNTLAQGLWALLLSRYTGEQDVVFGATTSGRPADLKHVEDMIGIFLNTLPVRTKISATQPVTDWMASLQEQQLSARQYEYAPLSDIQAWSDVARGTPLFNTLLIFENYPDVAALWEDRKSLSVRSMRAFGWTNFPLAAAVSIGQELVLRIDYDTQFYTAARIDQISGLYMRTLRALIEQPTMAVRELLKIPAPTIAHSPAPLPTNAYTPLPDTEAAQTLVQCFEQRAAEFGDATAVQTATESWTYAELNTRANGVAHALLDLQPAPGDRVGLLLGHNGTMLAGLLGALKAGQVYVPLDPGTPLTRLQTIISEAGISIVVADQSAAVIAALADQLATGTGISLVAANESLTADSSNPASRISGDSLAYILFTSGSTGTPKGVMQTHRNVLHHVRTYTDSLHIQANDKLSLFSPYGFDAAVMDIYGALLNGACLCPVDMKTAVSAEAVIEQLLNAGVTVFHATPTVYRFLFEQAEPHNLAAIRFVVLGGEEARPSDLQLFKRCFAKDALFVNGLGPTESTLALQYFADHGTPIPAGPLPVGRAVAGTEIRLLDPDGHSAHYGEICIVSRNVTPGYWNDPDFTAQALTNEPDGRQVYRSGDLGRLDIDGALLFLGRRDAQIKLRGHRIEPGEIEASLNTHPDVLRSVVLLRTDPQSRQRLVAWLIPAAASTIDFASVRAHAKDRLPDYMVPSAFALIADIPLTPNGKLDQRALPEPLWDQSSEKHVAPRNATEEQLAAIWTDILGVERVGIHDNFFELGGHSLIATRFVTRIRESLGVDVSLRSLFDNPTIAEHAVALGLADASDGGHLLAAQDRDGPIPLSFMQQLLWFLEQLGDTRAAYTLSWALRMRGEIDETALQSAINALLRRHEILRICFSTMEHEPEQLIRTDMDVALQIRTVDTADDAKLKAILQEQARVPFDIHNGPLLRVSLLRHTEQECVLQFMLHHIVGDGWSINILMRDLGELYQAELDQRAAVLPELTVQYADFAIWQQQYLAGEELERQLVYWKQRLAGAPTVLDLPTDRARPPVQTYNGAHLNWFVPNELLSPLKAIAQEEGASLFMILLAAWSVLLSRHANQDDLLIGTPIAGRQHRNVEDLIGFFVNMLALRIQIPPQSTFLELLRIVRAETLDAFGHQEMPFEKLVEEIRPERDMSRSPLFQTAFILQNAPSRESAFQQLECENVVFEQGTTKFDLTLGLYETSDGLGGAFEYNTDLFDAATIQRMAAHFEALLTGIVEQPNNVVADIPLLSPAEKTQLLEEWNATQHDFDTPDTLHGLFEKQQALTPDRIAVEFGGLQLRYRDLELRANRLAHRLRELGAGPEVRVALFLNRSENLAVGVLGILKSGAAYVPLDPVYPQERIDFMLEDSGASLIVTESSLQSQISTTETPITLIDELGEPDTSDNEPPANTGVKPNSLAYIIYTSGSTGKPKGVQLEHHSAVNFISAMENEPGFNADDRILGITTLCFDISVLELFLPFSVGATIVIATREQAMDGVALIKLLDNGITALQATPATFHILLQSEWAGSPNLKVMIGGEALDRELANQLHARVASVWNMYGPTETTVWSAVQKYSPDDDIITVGRPIANMRYHVLDEQQRPAPIGVAGELYIGGVGVSRGYRKRPDLNSAVFMPNPYSQAGNAQYYRTGDLARVLADGRFQILGRTDFQVKLRGFRLELGEIEAVLAAREDVARAVVILREDEPGDKRLAAYIVAKGTESPDPVELSEYLRAYLPAYMVPSAFVIMDALPLSPNGKVNRKALPEPEQTVQTEYTAPRTDIEQKLVEVWADVLGIDKVGVLDDFFQLGGHSLLATQLVSRLRKAHGIELPLMFIFEYPNVAALSVAIESMKIAADAGQEDLPDSDDLEDISL